MTANMKGYIKSVLVVTLSMLCAMAQGKTVASTSGVASRMEIPKAGSGAQGKIMEYTGFVLSYNTKTNCPNWVAWDLTAAEATATVAGRINDFGGDPRLPRSNRVESYDYKGSGYDRGHMCPAGDMKWSSNAMGDCFYMTNICPQDRTLNQKWWEHLERACRRWASKEGVVYICCGPIYNASKPTYIGNDAKVRVPDGFFKVVLSLKKGAEKAIGFIYKNDGSRQTMEDAAVTVDEVEAITGLDFFCNLDNALEAKLESSCDLKKWH